MGLHGGRVLTRTFFCIVQAQGLGGFEGAGPIDFRMIRMLKLRAPLRALAGTILLAGSPFHASCGSGPAAPSTSSQSVSSQTAAPIATSGGSRAMNIVVIMTDDQESVSAAEMPRMQQLIA